MPRRTPISPPARACRRSAPGPASSRGRWKAAFALEAAVASTTARFGVGTVPRPPHWTGFRIRPVAVEFWHDRPFRLHDRVVFTRPAADAAWDKTRLYP